MEINVFTDGASKGNPGPGGWGAVIHLGESVVELGGGEAETTNNRMELTAAINALRYIQNSRENITVFTDSSYLIQGITKWIYGWEKNNWKTKTKADVLNVDLWKELRTGVVDKNLTWRYVPGHQDVTGNERANDIAEDFALQKKPALYKGDASLHTLRLFSEGMPLSRNGKAASLKKDSSTKSRKTGSAYSYVSLLNGKIEIHKSWDECKKRVSGKPARFKKAMSQAEERMIVDELKQ
ncbi:MAG: ribonuclease HI [Candidatus Paceibacterota bacterium]